MIALNTMPRKQIEAEVNAITTRFKRADTSGDSWLFRGHYEEYDQREELLLLRAFKVDLEFAWIMMLDLLERLGHKALLGFAQKDYDDFKKEPSASAMGYEEPFLIWPARLSSHISILKDLYLPEPDLIGSPIEIDKLKRLIKNSEYYITKTNVFSWLPCVEEDVHNRIEGILKCAYPDLVRKPPLAKKIKGFIPDTGIPSLRTFIEYKFINNEKEAKAVLDEIFSDISGYKDHEYDRYIFVIYETDRVFDRSDWEEAVSSAQAKESIDVIVLQGSPFKVVDKTRRKNAMESRSKSAKKHLENSSAPKTDEGGLTGEPSQNNTNGPA